MELTQSMSGDSHSHQQSLQQSHRVIVQPVITQQNHNTADC